ncbi:interleukin-6 receptor subunit beta isoform X1 [Leuresthes tenuis]|uniref:interleukin-6 receptor subunit beta isoform X1 n=1 Tax=Leuresthes tenuis TaxID=355514 RepID=UPI003B515383
MVSARLFQLFGLACLASLFLARDGGGGVWSSEDNNYLVTAPQNPFLEIGTNFTATCMITNTAEVTVDDLYWNLSKTTVSKEHYIKINRTTLNVTVPIINEEPGWLHCLCNKKSPDVVLNKSKFMGGIWLRKGYRPEKPENLSCIAVQEKTYISPTISCEWKAVGRQTNEIPTTYWLIVKGMNENKYNTSTPNNRAQVSFDTYPNFMPLEIWVEAHNKLGTAESEHLKNEANFFVKTNPPSEVKAYSEKGFPLSLFINWTHPIDTVYVKLMYQIRFCPLGSHNWTYVPLADTDKYIQSYRLQKLIPDTVYTTQVRCKNHLKDYGYWSNWSTNATERTSECRPSSKPDLWKTTIENGITERYVQLICKEPQLSNGRISRFDVRINNKKDEFKNGSWESIPVNKSKSDSSSNQRGIMKLKKIFLPDKQSVKACVTASNSVGTSPEACLVISAKPHEHTPVKELKVWPHGDRLHLEWNIPNNTAVSEYVIEWISDIHMDWQRENRTTRHTTIKGNLERFVCYNVSVYPIYMRQIGKPARKEAYLEQGAPLQGPSVELNGYPGHDVAEVMWKEIPRKIRRGFITEYKIFYTNGTKIQVVTVPANTTSCFLKSLSANTRYDVWIEASTIRGSAKGSNHSFTTLKYESIEGTVVGVSIGFLFLVLMVILLCIYKKDVIEDNFWPRIPNPGESTIGNWSPDCHLTTEIPKEHCLSGISVLDVGVCDAKHGFDEDKASLSLKKDKYLSEEHSSGIGGSSCMSSPRQSVSDSDEGADMVDTTASTVQYSSVVASSGYKGQTPSSQPQHSIFSRSESTQPLLDSEENPDMLVQEGSQHFQRFPRRSRFTQGSESKDATGCTQLDDEQPDFCPFEEDTEQTTLPDSPSTDVSPAAPISSYMPQRGGYRPQ